MDYCTTNCGAVSLVLRTNNVLYVTLYNDSSNSNSNIACCSQKILFEPNDVDRSGISRRIVYIKIIDYIDIILSKHSKITYVIGCDTGDLYYGDVDVFYEEMKTNDSVVSPSYEEEFDMNEILSDYLLKNTSNLNLNPNPNITSPFIGQTYRIEIILYPSPIYTIDTDNICYKYEIVSTVFDSSNISPIPNPSGSQSHSQNQSKSVLDIDIHIEEYLQCTQMEEEREGLDGKEPTADPTIVMSTSKSTILGNKSEPKLEPTSHRVTSCSDRGLLVCVSVRMHDEDPNASNELELGQMVVIELLPQLCTTFENKKLLNPDSIPHKCYGCSVILHSPDITNPQTALANSVLIIPGTSTISRRFFGVSTGRDLCRDDLGINIHNNDKKNNSHSSDGCDVPIERDDVLMIGGNNGVIYWVSCKEILVLMNNRNIDIDTYIEEDPLHIAPRVWMESEYFPDCSPIACLCLWNWNRNWSRGQERQRGHRVGLGSAGGRNGNGNGNEKGMSEILVIGQLSGVVTVYGMQNTGGSHSNSTSSSVDANKFTRAGAGAEAGAGASDNGNGNGMVGPYDYEIRLQHFIQLSGHRNKNQNQKNEEHLSNFYLIEDVLVYTLGNTLHGTYIGHITKSREHQHPGVSVRDSMNMLTGALNEVTCMNTVNTEYSVLPIGTKAVEEETLKELSPQQLPNYLNSHHFPYGLHVDVDYKAGDKVCKSVVLLHCGMSGSVDNNRLMRVSICIGSDSNTDVTSDRDTMDTLCRLISERNSDCIGTVFSVDTVGCVGSVGGEQLSSSYCHSTSSMPIPSPLAPSASFSTSSGASSNELPLQTRINTMSDTIAEIEQYSRLDNMLNSDILHTHRLCTVLEESRNSEEKTNRTKTKSENRHGSGSNDALWLMKHLTITTTMEPNSISNNRTTQQHFPSHSPSIIDTDSFLCPTIIVELQTNEFGVVEALQHTSMSIQSQWFCVCMNNTMEREIDNDIPSNPINSHSHNIVFKKYSNVNTNDNTNRNRDEIDETDRAMGSDNQFKYIYKCVFAMHVELSIYEIMKPHRLELYISSSGFNSNPSVKGHLGMRSDAYTHSLNSNSNILSLPIYSEVYTLSKLIPMIASGVGVDINSRPETINMTDIDTIVSENEDSELLLKYPYCLSVPVISMSPVTPFTSSTSGSGSGHGVGVPGGDVVTMLQAVKCALNGLMGADVGLQECHSVDEGKPVNLGLRSRNQLGSGLGELLDFEPMYPEEEYQQSSRNNMHIPLFDFKIHPIKSGSVGSSSSSSSVSKEISSMDSPRVCTLCSTNPLLLIGLHTEICGLQSQLQTQTTGSVGVGVGGGGDQSVSNMWNGNWNGNGNGNWNMGREKLSIPVDHYSKLPMSLQQLVRENIHFLGRNMNPRHASDSDFYLGSSSRENNPLVSVNNIHIYDGNCTLKQCHVDTDVDVSDFLNQIWDIYSSIRQV